MRLNQGSYNRKKMISRRNIRIKAMQSVYILNSTSETKSVAEVKKIIAQLYEQSIHFTLASLLLTKHICEYSLIDASNRSNKHLPDSADMNVSTKIAANQVVQILTENISFNNESDLAKIAGRWSDNDIVKFVYKELTETPEYQKYITTERNNVEDKTMFKFALNFVNTNEDAQKLLEDLYINYDDDKLMIDDWIVKNFEILHRVNFSKILPEDKKEFGIELVQTFIEKYDETYELIRPKLENWDVERIAALDMIIIQLGITEMLYFPSIPTKVSINEYIDLAKSYSTRQSGKFVNGVLDKIHKDLIEEGRIHKLNA